MTLSDRSALVAEARKKARYCDTSFNNSSLGTLYRRLADELEASEPPVLARVGVEDLGSRAVPLSIEAWRPIETAPKDGAEILMFGSQRDHDMLKRSKPLAFTGYWDNIDESWCSVSSFWHGPFYDPTHWQPLPAPPEPQDPPTQDVAL